MTAKPPFSRGKRPLRATTPKFGQRQPKTAVPSGPGARTLSRRRALQVLFAWELSGRDIQGQLLQLVADIPTVQTTNQSAPTPPPPRPPKTEHHAAPPARRIPVPPQRFLEAVQQFPGHVQVLPTDAKEDSLETLPPAVINQAFYQELLAVFFERALLIDQTLAVFVDRPFAEIDPMEKSLLRLGATEILYFQQTPPQIILNETIELSKIFAGADSYKYINGILDKLVKRYRRDSPSFS